MTIFKKMDFWRAFMLHSQRPFQASWKAKMWFCKCVSGAKVLSKQFLHDKERFAIILVFG